MEHEELWNRFGFHSKSRVDHAREHEQIRQGCYYLAMNLSKLVPNPSRELSLAITHLEEVMFWANAGLARSDEQPDKLAQPNSDASTVKESSQPSDHNEIPQEQSTST